LEEMATHLNHAGVTCDEFVEINKSGEQVHWEIVEDGVSKLDLFDLVLVAGSRAAGVEKNVVETGEVEFGRVICVNVGNGALWIHVGAVKRLVTGDVEGCGSGSCKQGEQPVEEIKYKTNQLGKVIKSK
jgi:hypothetical protein